MSILLSIFHQGIFRILPTEKGENNYYSIQFHSMRIAHALLNALYVSEFNKCVKILLCT